MEGSVAGIDATIADGDTFTLEITDAVKKVYHKGTEVISSTDPDISPGCEYVMALSGRYIEEVL